MNKYSNGLAATSFQKGIKSEFKVEHSGLQ